MKRILVTGAGGAPAFNFIESLRLADEEFYIVGTDINKYHLKLSNADKNYCVPPVGDKAYLSTLNSIIAKEKIEFVHPQPDVEVRYLSSHIESLSAKTFLPSKEVIFKCQNKIETNNILSQAGVPVAESYVINNKQDLIEKLNLILKTNEKAWLRATVGAGSKAALPVKKIEHASSWIDYWTDMRGIGYGDFMVSEFLPGSEFAFQSVWHNGKLITSQARERCEYVFGHLTPSGQSSSPSVARTISRDDVNDVASRAILAVDKNASGVFCVDLKENKEKIPCVMEINAGRFFTTSNFFSTAGINMPYIYVELGYSSAPADNIKQYNSLEEGLYWIRLMDMGKKLVREVELDQDE